MAFIKQTFVDGVTIVTAAWLNGIQEVVGAAAVVPEYSADQVYAAGTLASHGGKMYECNTTISTPEPWTAAHWTEVSFEGLLDEKLEASDLSAITNAQIDTLYG